MHCPEAGVDHDVEQLLGMRALLEALPAVHRFYLPEDALHEDLTGLWPLADCHQGLVYLLGPLEVRMDHILVLVEGPADHQQPKQPEKQLAPLRLIEDAKPLAVLHHQALP